jgi:hypothetical protein
MPTRIPVARDGWSGVGHLALGRNPADISRLMKLLPKRKSTNLALKGQLRYLGAQFQRYLHQDEFGPTRVDQAAGLKSFLETVRNYKSSPDFPSLENLANLLDALDTNASGELLLESCVLGLDLTKLGESCTALEAGKRLNLLENAVRITIQKLKKPGPIDQKSVNFFVFKLSELWQQETGTKPTGSTSNYETPFETFAQTAVDIFKPNAEWLQARIVFMDCARAQRFAINKNRYRPSVRQAIRKIRQLPNRDAGRPPSLG